MIVKNMFSKFAPSFLAALVLGLVTPISAVETVTISGSSTVLPLVEANAEIFNLLQSDYFVSVTGGGTGAGLIGIAERRYDLAMASRELSQDEINRFGNNFSEFIIGYDGIVIAVSPSIYDSGITDLSIDQVNLMYSGEIKNWKDLGGPDKEIYVISREPGSGTRDTFNEVIMGNITIETPGVDTVALGSAEVKTAISGSDKAIGYLGFSYAESGDIRPIALDGILATTDNIRKGSYELSRRLYLYSYGEPSNGSRVFIDFLRSPEGQRIAEENGFIAMSSDFAEQTEESKDNGKPEIMANETGGPMRQPGFEAAFSLITILVASCCANMRVRKAKGNFLRELYKSITRSRKEGKEL